MFQPTKLRIFSDISHSTIPIDDNISHNGYFTAFKKGQGM